MVYDMSESGLEYLKKVFFAAACIGKNVILSLCSHSPFLWRKRSTWKMPWTIEQQLMFCVETYIQTSSIVATQRVSRLQFKIGIEDPLPPQYKLIVRLVSNSRNIEETKKSHQEHPIMLRWIRKKFKNY